MNDRKDEHVPRGDNASEEERQDSSSAQRGEELPPTRPRANPGLDSAPKRGHGAHGKGVGEQEARFDPVNVEPGHAEEGPRGSDAWGSERSGGSVIDKR